MVIMVVDTKIDLHTIPLEAPAGGSKDTTGTHLLYHLPQTITPFTPLLHQSLMQTTPSILKMNHHTQPITTNNH
jgi:hypothetical protein